MLYKKRMERQLAAARGEGPAGEKPPDEVRTVYIPAEAESCQQVVLSITWIMSSRSSCLALERLPCRGTGS